MNLRCFLSGISLAFLTVSFLDFNPAWAAPEIESQAKKAFEDKEYSQVVSLLMPNMAKVSRNSLLILGKAQSELKNHEAALKVYSAGISLNPKDLELKSLYGRELFRSGKDKEGMIILKEILDTNHKFLPAYRYLIEIYEKKKNKYELRLLYQDLVEKFGEKPEFVTKLCELTTQDGFFDLAKKYCVLGVSQSPKEPENYVYLGLTYKYTANFEDAEKYLKRAADSFSKSFLAQLSYAHFLEEKKNYIQAFSYFQRALNADPQSSQALVGIGNMGLEIQKLTDSLAAFEKACKLDRTTLPAFRKATNTLRLARNESWKRKFELSLDKCN